MRNVSSDSYIRLPYSRPELRSYGTIDSVTWTLGMTSEKNDGGEGKTKTS